MRTLIIAATAVAALFATEASAAGANQDVRKVSFRGVNFNDQAQVDAFYSRLQRTARDVCNSGMSHDHRGRQLDRACAASVMDQAVNGMQRPMLTAQHQIAGNNTRYATGF